MSAEPLNYANACALLRKAKAALDEVTAQRDRNDEGWRQTTIQLNATEATLEARNREVGRLVELHYQQWRSTSDEVWGRPGFCVECQQSWPCSTVEILAATSPPSTTGGGE